MQVPITCRVSGIDDLDRSLGFWLRDGGNARRCHSRVQTGCGVQPHSRKVGNGIGSDIVLLGTAIVTKLAYDQFNDQRVPNMSECSICDISDWGALQKFLSTYTKDQ
jgi:hypothetical protein